MGKDIYAYDESQVIEDIGSAALYHLEKELGKAVNLTDAINILTTFNDQYGWGSGGITGQFNNLIGMYAPTIGMDELFLKDPLEAISVMYSIVYNESDDSIWENTPEDIKKQWIKIYISGNLSGEEEDELINYFGEGIREYF